MIQKSLEKILHVPVAANLLNASIYHMCLFSFKV